jgi:hypothetical protein
MTIKISQLANLTIAQGNTIVPVVSNITGTLTTVQANVQQLQTYMLGNAGNLIPRAGNIYSIGNSTTWWKDLWLSANTFYIGGVPISTAGGSLTLGGNVVGTSDLPSYTGNVSAGNIAVGATTVGNTTTAPTFSVEGSTGNITAGNITAANITSTGDLGTYSVSTPTMTSNTVKIGYGGMQYLQGCVASITMTNPGADFNWMQNPYYPQGGTGHGLTLVVSKTAKPGGAILEWDVYNPGEGYTAGDIVTIDTIFNNAAAQFTIDSTNDSGTTTVADSIWVYDPSGTTTFPGNTTIDSDGNISIGSTTVGNTITPATFSVEGYTGNISAGNVFVYSVESDTISLTLPSSASDMLPSYDGGVILSTGTISTNLTTQYWGFNPNGVTWFTVASTTDVTVGMQIYWAGYLIGTVTGVTSGNVACTPLTATPNFVNGSPVSFGNPAPLYTDEVTASGGNLTITGNITNTGNVTVSGNITVLSWLKGPSTGNLNISSGSGQPIRLLANAGAKTWTFNSNGSVTFPDSTLQTSAGTSYSNVQVTSYLPTYNGNIGELNMIGDIDIFGTLNVGTSSNIAFGNTIVNALKDANSYVQLNVQNINTVGNLVSADFIATAPNGTDSTKFIDMGINGNNYSSSAWTVSGPNDGYVYINSGNLTLGTDTPNTTVKVHVGGTLAGNVVTTFSKSNVTICGNLIVCNVYVPTANNSVGTVGQIAWDSGYVYICIAANTWKRANISTW